MVAAVDASWVAGSTYEGLNIRKKVVVGVS